MTLALRPVRLVSAVLVWGACAVLGWWWHTPNSKAVDSTRASTHEDASMPATAADLSQDPLWSQISAKDPFGLKREGPNAAAAAPASVAASDTIVWRFAALTVNRGQRTLLLTAVDQAPLLLKEGDKLPNGERVKSIQADRVQLQDARGRKRTIQLIEP